MIKTGYAEYIHQKGFSNPDSSLQACHSVSDREGLRTDFPNSLNTIESGKITMKYRRERIIKVWMSDSLSAKTLACPTNLYNQFICYYISQNKVRARQNSISALLSSYIP